MPFLFSGGFEKKKSGGIVCSGGGGMLVLWLILQNDYTIDFIFNSYLIKN